MLLFRSFQDLSLKSDDLVYPDSRVDLHWLRGHSKNGASGIFPKNVVEIVVSGWGRPSRWAAGAGYCRVWSIGTETKVADSLTYVG